jgi:uncharacterized protein (TIGR02453 family)
MDAKNILKFIEKLAENNNREWFAANKEWYLEVKNEVDQFAKLWLERLVELDPELAGLEPKDCVYRIYRDIRFSPNKEPYKHWMGIYVAKKGGRKSPYGGYYLHLQPGQCMFAAGMWCPNPDLLNAVRRELQANYEEVEEIMAAQPFKRYFGDFDQTYMLKRVPAGYDADFPHPDWLRQKWFIISTPFTDSEICKPAFLDRLLDIARAAKPMNDFLNYTFEEYGEFPSRC